jgi:hypothetical protein
MDLLVDKPGLSHLPSKKRHKTHREMYSMNNSKTRNNSWRVGPVNEGEKFPPSQIFARERLSNREGSLMVFSIKEFQEKPKAKQ